MRRRAVAVALLVSLLAACDAGPGDAPPGPDGGELSGSIDVQLSGGEGEINAARALVDAFVDAHPGTSVNLIPVPSAGDHVAKLATAFAAGNPPDVFLINYRRFGSFVRSGVIDPAPAEAAAGLYPKTVEAFTHDGRLTCLPQNASSMVVYVNPALFAKAGVPLPKPGWTWTDMLRTAMALAGEGVEAIAFETGLVRLAPFVWSNGGEIVDDPDDPTAVTLDAPPAREALRFLLDLQRTGLDATQRAGQEPEAAFAAGEVAMLLESRRAVPGLRKTAGLDFDVVGVPRKKSAVSVLHADGYCVSRDSENRTLAHAFARYAVSTEGATVLARTGRTVPSLQQLAESPVFLDPTAAPRSSKVFLDAIPTLRAMPSAPGWNEAEEVAEDILTQLFAGRLSLDAAVERIAEDTADVLAQSG
ncbi:MAG TPA: sugar ABC transporter substrate-binding protein [Mycobacteriales bacterium]|nr:sugar ABC transporter substrate-binding protein [Mycobacteriales bacterium]